MDAISNVETQNDYADDLTVEQDLATSLLLVVANKSAAARLRPARRESGGDESYGGELPFTPQTLFIGNVSGAKFRSLEAGQPARIIAVLTGEGDPQLSAGVPFLQTLTAGGQVSGVELAYVELAPGGGNSFEIVTEASPTTFLSFPTLVFDGATRVHLEVFCPDLVVGGNSLVGVNLWDDTAADLGRLCLGEGPATVGDAARFPVALHRYFTPGASSIRYRIRAWGTAGGNGFNVSAGVPAYARLSIA